MSNQRRHYRHTFDRETRLEIRLLPRERGVSSAEGELINLSVGGMRIKLDRLSPGQRTVRDWRVEADLPVECLRRGVLSSVVYREDRPEGVYVGLQFSTMIDEQVELSRDREIGRFLIDEQRKRLTPEPRAV
jgi:hypothetical protein